MKLPLSLFFCATVPLFTGCQKASQPATSAELPPAHVHVQVAERKPTPVTEEVVGTVRPKLSAVIEAKVSGRIEQMLVVPGQSVKAGDLLIELNAREIQAHFDQASALRQQAQSDLKRASDLYQQKILSQSEFDQAQSKFRVADATASEAQTLLGYTKITAAFSGVITRKLADVGDLAMPGKPLLQMEDPDTLRLDADVPEALISNMKLGDKLAVHISTVNDTIQGTVAEISPAADPNSRTFLMKLDLPKMDGLRSGEFGRVAVPIGVQNAIHVPASAVLLRGQMEIVFVDANRHAQLRLVKTGRHFTDETEIVSGLDPGESIVTDDIAQLKDGQPLAVEK